MGGPKNQNIIHSTSTTCLSTVRHVTLGYQRKNGEVHKEKNMHEDTKVRKEKYAGIKRIHKGMHT